MSRLLAEVGVMNATILISIIVCILVLFSLILFYTKRTPRFSQVLILGNLLFFSIVIALLLQSDVSPIQWSPVSPFSPVSPLAASSLAVTEVEFGGCLAFVSNRTGNFEIYMLQGTTDNLNQLTHDPALDINPAWSPNGEIAFASSRETDQGLQLYVMNADGTHLMRLGPAQPGDNAHPSWSPDGKKIAFQSKRDINSNPSDDNLDVYVMNSDGSQIINLTNHEADDSEPAWSPNGQQIAFLSERSGRDEIYLMNNDGTNPIPLTDMAVPKSSLNWSKDGRFILFEGDSDIYIVDVETRETLNITQTKDVHETTPTWVGNENIIVFASDRAGNWDLYLADISNPNEILLARLTDDPSTDHSPAWFPCNND
ncbi:MAG: hypothetical protein QXQ02_04230 [Halobacteria archaeon]